MSIFESKFVAEKDFKCDKKTACCFTGHRRKDLPFKGDMYEAGMKRLWSVLTMYIGKAYEDGYRTFICGMAEGIDLLCAQIVNEMKKTGRFEDMRLVGALPYKEHYTEIKKGMDRYMYSMMLECCDELVCVSVKSDKERYRRRNKFMVDNSSMLIAVIKHKEKGSGSLMTINMARKAGLMITAIKLDESAEAYGDMADGEQHQAWSVQG